MLFQRRARNNDDNVNLGVVTNIAKRSDDRRDYLVFRGKHQYVILVIGILLLLHWFVVGEYAWVNRRCLLATFSMSTRKKIECQEAWSHRAAHGDTRLLWSTELVPSLSKRELEQIQEIKTNTLEAISKPQSPSVEHIHFTLTSPFRQASTRGLGKCSVEAAARFCDGCHVHLWVTDQAIKEESDLLYMKELVELIHTTNKSRPCVHFDAEVVLNATGTAVFTTECPKPTKRSEKQGFRMRKWLSTKLAASQLPQHLSDAWRLIALLEWGGLYLDVDVIPLSPLLVRLPMNSVPTQHKPGAYRMNGGVLRLGDEWRDATQQQQQPSFLSALEGDHLYWAPRVAKLPLKDQPFGFLGPASLTRTFVSQDFHEEVTVLPEDVVEPIVSSNACKLWADNRTLALHFSGKNRKLRWGNLVKQNECLKGIVQQACPTTMGILPS